MPPETQPAVPGFATAMLTQSPADEAARAQYPLLMQCLLPIWKESKCLRQAGSIRVRLVGSYYMVSINCPTEGVEATLTAESIIDLPLQLENALQLNRLQWIPDYERVKGTRKVRID